MTDSNPDRMPDASDLPLVSVLFVTYKRFDLLERAVHSFRRNTSYPKLEVVIADDGSGPEIQDQIRKLPADVFALSPVNQGLGPNNNNGLKHCTGKYILMIQDDWGCFGPPDYLLNAVRVMEANPTVGTINFCGAPHPADLNQRLAGSENPPCYLTPKPYDNPQKEEFLYSDQPHLISREAQDFIGPYIYHRHIENSENDYCARWKAQTRYSAAMFPDYYRKVFLEFDTSRSFRNSRARYRVGVYLQPLKPLLPKAVIKVGKAVVLKSIYGLEKLRIVR
ncbi:MAG: glycosyltransferase family 2 protein [Silvibacterium sp.]|nr:glycosyltransferase family 2 protein [Silvibacterium sp.]